MNTAGEVAGPQPAGDEMSHPQPESTQKRLRAFVLLRFTLIIASAYLLLEQTGFKSAPAVILVLLGIGVASNLAIFRLPARWTDAAWFSATVVVFDTVWITAALLITRRFEPEFFYLYFLVLFLAAVGENLRLVVIGSLVIAGGYLFGLAKLHGFASILTTSSLIRIPFLFAVAAFYGYMVVRVRAEKRRAEQEAETVAGLEKMRQALEEHARQVERARDDLQHEVQVRRQVEEELRKLTRAVEQSPSMVIITDTDGLVEYVNSRFVAATGIGWDEAVGAPLSELEGADADDAPWQALRERGEWEGECVVSLRGGGTFWTATSISHLVDDDGETEHCIVVQQDISERKLAEKALRMANEELTNLNQLKSDFVSTVSHELRTPITAIKNSVDLLHEDDALDETTRERFFSIATRNVERLRWLIDDLLDLSKLEAGKLEFHFARLQAADLLREIFASFEARPEENRPHLELQIADGFEPVWADAHRIEQVVVNLMSNAIKFTPPEGEVTLAAAAGDGGVEISVADTGIGISDEDMKRVFDRFYQAGSSLTGKHRGTGLGLSIARDFIRIHGGELVLASELGKGSRFSFVLPLFSPRTAEMATLEERLWGQHVYPFFGVMVLGLEDLPPRGDDAPATEQVRKLRDDLRTIMPRASDIFVEQPAHHRIVLALVGTGRDGSEVVRRKLRAAVESGQLDDGVRVWGPAVYPDDGITARELVGHALGSGGVEGIST
jgi:PAS domain S-box-containing protein